MTASLLNGKLTSKTILKQLQTLTKQKIANGSRAPGLAVVLLNLEPASAIYVAHKRKACAYIGFNAYDYDLPAQTSEAELLKLIQTLNAAPHVDGILVQLPLPSHINTQRIIEAIRPDKDVDGFHPYNLGRLAQRHPLFRPCTPYGIMQLLNAYQIQVAGKHAVVIGASNIVGRPMALEFLMAGATVTVCHRKTTHLEQHVKMAEILVVATGMRDCVKPAWLQPNQILIDVGMHRLPDNSVCGDVPFEQAKHLVAWITPVPGGVGPMTVACLMQNTFTAYEAHQSQS
jgi:methylenetetrahydrofolate dehydrogenase (NADP+)/methenyltetrahydrofolate cyclohydrolase